VTVALLCEGDTDTELLGTPGIEPEMVSGGTGILSEALGVVEGTSPEGGSEDNPSGGKGEPSRSGVLDDTGGSVMMLETRSQVASEVVIDPGSSRVVVGSEILVLACEVPGMSIAAGRRASGLADQCFISLR